MAKRSERNHKNNKQARQAFHEVPDTHPPTEHYKPAAAPFEARTETQRKYAAAIKSGDLIFGVGPAGTGKTYVPTALAAQALASKETNRIIISRPAVEAGESLGFLPGELEEKYEPYLAPVRQIFTERMGSGPFEYALKTRKIEPIPLAFMRGMTFKNAWVIIDEAQNISPKQMKMLLTRIGENCKVIVCGDTDQVDIAGLSGLADAVRRIRGIKGVRVVRFTEDDVVRSELVMNILKAYSSEDSLEV